MRTTSAERDIRRVPTSFAGLFHPMSGNRINRRGVLISGLSRKAGMHRCAERCQSARVASASDQNTSLDPRTGDRVHAQKAIRDAPIPAFGDQRIPGCTLHTRSGELDYFIGGLLGG